MVRTWWSLLNKLEDYGLYFYILLSKQCFASIMCCSSSTVTAVTELPNSANHNPKAEKTCWLGCVFLVSRF